MRETELVMQVRKLGSVFQGALENRCGTVEFSEPSRLAGPIAPNRCPKPSTIGRERRAFALRVFEVA